MNIALLGNGKMGKRIKEIAKKRGHNIIITCSSQEPATSKDLSIADVAIDFSTPDSACKNIIHAINHNIPVVSGTTGWLNELQKVKNLCYKKKGALLYASNFSLGMNLFFELNKKLSKLMKEYNYNTYIHEIHHTEKKDAPSGTSITLAEQIYEVVNKKPEITSERINDITGTHIISYKSSNDEIEIKHIAKNRNEFAIGAIIAAEWIINKRGFFSMNDILVNPKK